MSFFVSESSIVRRIWGKGDTILFIFGGSAAEFALNKAVDWLYFTGKLPADPLGRLFSTVAYARQIVFSDTEKANAAIDRMRSIHSAVEQARAAQIPDWAYRDVLFMLIHYSISSFELLERKLSREEKEEVFDVFFRVGARMQLEGLPASYTEWLVMREKQLNDDLEKGVYTIDLYRQYRKHLGAVRYFLLLEGQRLVVPQQVKTWLGLKGFSFLSVLLPVYSVAKKFRADWLLKSVLLPPAYREQIRNLDV